MRKCGQMQLANSDAGMRPKRHVSDRKKCFSATAVAALSYGSETIYIVVMSHCGPSCADTTMSQMSQRPSTRNCFLITTGVTFQYEKCHTSGLTPATKCETAARAMWPRAIWHCPPLVAASLPPVQVRLRLSRSRQRARPRVVPHPAHQQLLRRELGDDLAPVRRHHQLLLDTGRRPAIRRWPEGLQGEGHPFLNGLRGIQRDVPAEDGLLPDGEPHPVPVLQRERPPPRWGSQTLGRVATGWPHPPWSLPA